MAKVAKISKGIYSKGTKIGTKTVSKTKMSRLEAKNNAKLALQNSKQLHEQQMLKLMAKDPKAAKLALKQKQVAANAVTGTTGVIAAADTVKAYAPEKSSSDRQASGGITVQGPTGESKPVDSNKNPNGAPNIYEEIIM